MNIVKNDRIRKRGRPKIEEVVEVELKENIFLGKSVAKIVAQLIYQLWKEGKIKWEKR